MREISLLLVLMAFVGSVQAQKVKTVSAVYTYYVPENISIEDAKRTALERAKIEAIASEFGTVVSQSNSMMVSNRNGETNSQFYSFGGSDVKGEWIETIEEPKFEVQYLDRTLVVKCSVNGRIREIISATIDINARVLRNGTEDRFESEEFRHGDDLYLSFVSPIDGYLAVYLVDAEQRAYCLLPYRNQSDGIYKVAANRHYTFFNAKEAEPQERQYVDEYTMTSERSSEQNQIYIVFSPQPFAKAIDNATAGTLPRELDFKEFQKWLVRCRTKDKQMLSVSKMIVIKSK